MNEALDKKSIKNERNLNYMKFDHFLRENPVSDFFPVFPGFFPVRFFYGNTVVPPNSRLIGSKMKRRSELGHTWIKQIDDRSKLFHSGLFWITKSAQFNVVKSMLKKIRINEHKTGYFKFLKVKYSN